MKPLPVIVLSFFIVSLISCEDDNNPPNDCLKGSGSTITETKTVSSFHSIEATVVGNLYISQGPTQELTITTHPNVMAELETSVVNHVLKIGTDRCISDIEKLDVFITIPDIESITFAGVGNIESENDWDLDNLSVTFSGVGTTLLSGNTDNFNYTLSGVGDLMAFNLSTKSSSIVISGNGNAEITATENLNVVIAGNGHVSYKGNPNLTSNISGNGSVINAN